MRRVPDSARTRRIIGFVGRAPVPPFAHGFGLLSRRPSSFVEKIPKPEPPRSSLLRHPSRQRRREAPAPVRRRHTHARRGSDRRPHAPTRSPAFPPRRYIAPSCSDRVGFTRRSLLILGDRSEVFRCAKPLEQYHI
jgi:hypothetical protein